MNSIFSHLQNKIYILIGEIHGIKENVEILKLFTELYFTKYNSKLILAFEWPVQLEKEINAYIQNHGDLNWRKWEFIKYKDGRISKEHIFFLKWVKKINFRLQKSQQIKIRCFDVIAKNWNERDKKMANILLHNIKDKRVKVVAIMGNFHASKKPFVFDGVKYIPLGSYLPKNKTISVKLEYMSGYFCNGTIKKILPITKNINFVSKFVLRKTGKSGYDYILLVKKANPTR